MKKVEIKNIIDREELTAIVTPERTATHYPIPHAMVADKVHGAIENKGYSIERESYQLSHDGARCFGTLTLADNDVKEFKTQITFGNSHDKAFAFWSKLATLLLKCTNGMIVQCNQGEAVRRKHTSGIMNDWSTIDNRIGNLFGNISALDKRFERMKRAEINEVQSAQIIEHAFMNNALPTTKYKDVVKEYRSNSTWLKGTMFSLEQAFTEQFKTFDRVETLNDRSMNLQSIMDRHTDLILDVN